MICLARVRVYAETDADIDLLREQLTDINDEYFDMTLRDVSTQLVNYRELNILVALMCSMLKYLVLIAGCISVILQMLTKARFNRENYSLYRLNGMHFSKIICIFMIQMIIMLLASFAVLLIIMLALNGYLNAAKGWNIYSLSINDILIFMLVSFIGSTAGSAVASRSLKL